jgi:hypothetical protein
MQPKPNQAKCAMNTTVDPASTVRKKRTNIFAGAMSMNKHFCINAMSTNEHAHYWGESTVVRDMP